MKRRFVGIRVGVWFALLASIAIGTISVLTGTHRVLEPAGAEGAVHEASRADVPTLRSTLPTEAEAKTVLNSTLRHGEWVRVPAGSATILTWVMYPDRSNRAPLVVLTANNQGLTDWLRAVGDQVAEEGFIVVIPDLLSGTGPNGGHSDSFENREAMTDALGSLGPAELRRRVGAVRDYALRFPAANRMHAMLDLRPDSARRIDATVASKAGDPQASFTLNTQGWREAMEFLHTHTENQPSFLPPHSGHAVMAQPATGSASLAAVVQSGGRYPTGKADDLPAGLLNARSIVDRSPMRAEWVEIPVGDVNVRTRITYPEGEGTAAIVILMQHGPGLDAWMLAVGDQLSRDGFIAIAPDLHSGFGPDGGGYDSFAYPDEVLLANSRITPEETMRRFKAARDYGMNLPEANGHSASLGFCAGGGNAFKFAGEVSELDAAVVFYGGAPDEATMANIQAPVIAFYGSDDVRLAAAVPDARATMERLGKTFEAHIYPHATHSFLQYQNIGGNPEATADAWPRAIAFLRLHTE